MQSSRPRSFMKFLAHYLLGNFSIFPKGGRSSTSEVPGLVNFILLDNGIHGKWGKLKIRGVQERVGGYKMSLNQSLHNPAMESRSLEYKAFFLKIS